MLQILKKNLLKSKMMTYKITLYPFYRLNIDKKKINEAEEYFRKTGKKQSGVLTFENLNAHDCPDLDQDD